MQTNLNPNAGNTLLHAATLFGSPVTLGTVVNPSLHTTAHASAVEAPKDRFSLSDKPDLSNARPTFSLHRPPVTARPQRPNGNDGNGGSGRVFRKDINIGQIKQGYVSEFHKQLVAGIQGVVTHVKRSGFYLQNDDGAIFIYMNGRSPDEAGVVAGAKVEIAGEITRYESQDERDKTNLKVAQIGVFPDRISVLSKDNALPEAINIGSAGLIPPKKVISDETRAIMASANIDDVESKDMPFEIGRDALAFYHHLVGTRISLKNAEVVGASDDKKYFYVVPDRGERISLKSPRGGAVLSENDLHTEIFKIDVAALPPEARPLLKVGDKITSDLVGVFEYSYGQFQVRLTESFTHAAGTLAPSTTKLTGDAEHLTFGNYNVENLDPSDAERFDEIAAQIVNNMKAPDVLSLQEVQDDDGKEDSGKTSAKKTLDLLIKAIKKLDPSLQYEAVNIDPANNQDGGQPGGNIRVAYLVNTNRVTLNRFGNANHATEIEVTAKKGEVSLNHNPVRLGTNAEAFAHTRKPLVMEVEFNGEKIFFINAHLSSKRGDANEWGIQQPPVRHSEKARIEQARLIAELKDRILKLNPNARIVVSGDMNEHYYRKPMQELNRDGLVHAPSAMLTSAEIYTYNFRGRSQDLDQLFVSAAIMAGGLELDMVHINSEFPKTKDHSGDAGGRSAETDYRQVSDHDGMVGRMKITKKAA